MQQKNMCFIIPIPATSILDLSGKTISPCGKDFQDGAVTGDEVGGKFNFMACDFQDGISKMKVAACYEMRKQVFVATWDWKWQVMKLESNFTLGHGACNMGFPRWYISRHVHIFLVECFEFVCVLFGLKN